MSDPLQSATLPQSNAASEIVVSADAVHRIGSGTVVAICGGLVLAVVGVFAQTAWFDFINCDDPTYVTLNPAVNRGLTVDGVIWAFTRVHSSNWHALTWLSHMVDCQIYGLWAGGHHITNVILHAANAVLLFLVLRRMTGITLPSALAAALFAVHPLRAESVAWVSERKDVLSGLFFMLTLAAHTRFSVTRRFRVWDYLAVTTLFFAGLLAKPMLVTLPCLLLLLDVWPLQRVKGQIASAGRAFPTVGIVRLVGEKVPLLALSVLASVMTIRAQAEAMYSVADLPMPQRFASAVFVATRYVGDFLVPRDLAVFYPLDPTQNHPLVVAACAGFLAVVSVIAWLSRRRSPSLFVGWNWYLGMLVPVSGLLQAGGQARADRFTYLPQIGLAIMVAYGLHARAVIPNGAGCKPARRGRVCGVAAMIWLLALSEAAFRQTGHWRNAETIWRHTIAVTSRNGFAYLNLGLAVEDAGREADALVEYLRAVDIAPAREVVEGAARCARRLAKTGRTDEARAVYQTLVDRGGTVEWMLIDFANLLFEAGESARAAAYRDWAMRSCAGDQEKRMLVRSVAGLLELPSPQRPPVNSRRPAPEVIKVRAEGMRAVRASDYTAAFAAFRRATDVDPACAEAHNNIGMACSQLRRDSEAELAFRQASAADPTRSDYQANLANVLFTLERWDEAAAACERVLAIDPLDVETAALFARAEAHRRSQ